MVGYEQIFLEALKNYTSRAKRAGYASKFYTNLKHSNKLYNHIKNLQENLLDPSLDAKTTLTNYLTSPKTKFNSHSFSMYLIDALEASRPKENWGGFYPKGKKVVFYSGKLYRGTQQPPKSAFNHGITSGSRSTLEPYTNDTSTRTGVSTSKDQVIARSYAHLQLPGAPGAGTGANFNDGWVYKINYRGLGGVDIVETHKVRNNILTLRLTACKAKKEVNVIGKIEVQDIEGCWDLRGRWIKNSNYEAGLKVKSPTTFLERRTLLFLDTLKEDSSLTRCIQMDPC